MYFNKNLIEIIETINATIIPTIKIATSLNVHKNQTLIT